MSNYITPLISLTMVAMAAGFIGFIVLASIGASRATYLTSSDETKLTFRKPWELVASGISIVLGFLAGMSFQMLSASPKYADSIWLFPLLYVPLILCFVIFMGPESLDIDLKRSEYRRIRTWFAIRTSGALSDFKCIRAVKLTPNNRSVQYICKLDWTSGQSMVIGKAPRWTKLEQAAEVVASALKIPILDVDEHWTGNSSNSVVTNHDIRATGAESGEMDLSMPRFKSSVENDLNARS